MPDQIESKKKFTDQELTVFLAGQIAGLKANFPDHIKRAQQSGKYTLKQLMNMKAAGIEEVDKLEAILSYIVMPPPKDTGAKWNSDKKGGFELHVYISPQDVAAVSMPEDDAKTFTENMNSNKAAGVIAAMAMLWVHWEKMRQRHEQIIVNEAKKALGHA